MFYAEQLKIRVKLSSESKYSPTRSNPVSGSNRECSGTIYSMVLNSGNYTKSNIRDTINKKESNGFVRVIWDNGSLNSYKMKELVLEPTIDDKYESIW